MGELVSEATGWTSEELWFDSCQGQETFISSPKRQDPPLLSSQYLNHWVKDLFARR